MKTKYSFCVEPIMLSDIDYVIVYHLTRRVNRFIYMPVRALRVSMIYPSVGCIEEDLRYDEIKEKEVRRIVNWLNR